MPSDDILRELAEHLIRLADPYAADVLYCEKVEDEDYEACLGNSRLSDAARAWIEAMLMLTVEDRWRVWDLAYPDPKALTVSEFVRQLQQFPPDAPVLFMVNENLQSCEAAAAPKLKAMSARVRSQWRTPWTYHEPEEVEEDGEYIDGGRMQAGMMSPPSEAVVLTKVRELKPRWQKG